MALEVPRLIVVSTGMSHRNRICFRDLLLSCCGIWRCTQTSLRLDDVSRRVCVWNTEKLKTSTSISSMVLIRWETTRYHLGFISSRHVWTMSASRLLAGVNIATLGIEKLLSYLYRTCPTLASMTHNSTQPVITRWVINLTIVNKPSLFGRVNL